MNFKLGVALLIGALISLNASADCSIALMAAGNGNTSEGISLLEKNLTKEVMKLDKKNSVTIVDTPEEASDMDYFIFLTPMSGGVRIAINNILINNTFYSNEYNLRKFTSSMEAVEKMSSDVVKYAFPDMRHCKK